MDLDRLEWLLMKAKESHTLTAWEQKFVSDLTARFKRWGANTSISERPEEILEEIAGKD